MFFKIAFVREVGMCVCVCLTSRLLLSSGMIWIPYDWLNKFYSCYVAAVVGIISRCGFRNKVCHRNQTNKE